MTCERFDLHVVAFPFSDSPRIKRRPVLVLSNAAFHRATGNVQAAMITSASHSDWPGDTPIEDLPAAGLKAACKVRMRLVTLEITLLGGRIGALSASDAWRVRDALRAVLIA